MKRSLKCLDFFHWKKKRLFFSFVSWVEANNEIFLFNTNILLDRRKLKSSIFTSGGLLSHFPISPPLSLSLSFTHTHTHAHAHAHTCTLYFSLPIRHLCSAFLNPLVLTLCLAVSFFSVYIFSFFAFSATGPKENANFMECAVTNFYRRAVVSSV